jgi:hypothetical protein
VKVQQLNYDRRPESYASQKSYMSQTTVSSLPGLEPVPAEQKGPPKKKHVRTKSLGARIFGPAAER